MNKKEDFELKRRFKKENAIVTAISSANGVENF